MRRNCKRLPTPASDLRPPVRLVRVLLPGRRLEPELTVRSRPRHHQRALGSHRSVSEGHRRQSVFRWTLLLRQGARSGADCRPDRRDRSAVHGARRRRPGVVRRHCVSFVSLDSADSGTADSGGRRVAVSRLHRARRHANGGAVCSALIRSGDANLGARHALHRSRTLGRVPRVRVQRGRAHRPRR